MAGPSEFIYNENYYLQQNPDVRAAVSAGAFNSGLSHWLAYGKSEGRKCSPFFDADVYARENPDLNAAGINNPSELLQHFLSFGFQEGRIFMRKEFFDYEYYAEHNPDLAQAGITTKQQLQDHFLNHGISEGRSGSASFSGAEYVDQYSDLKAMWEATGGNLFGFTSKAAFGIYHFYHYGIAEGRSPVPPAEISFPELKLSINVGGDEFINLKEAGESAGITIELTSSELDHSTLKVSGIRNGKESSLLALWNSHSNTYDFDANYFDDGNLTVTVTDIHNQSKDLILIKDTIAPSGSLLDYEDGPAGWLLFAMSEPGTVSLVDDKNLEIFKTLTIVEEATSELWMPNYMLILPQFTTAITTLQLTDQAGNSTYGTERVILGTERTNALFGDNNSVNWIFGFAGNDEIHGGTLKDVIYAGNGNDVIIGYAGDDEIDMGSGSNTVFLSSVNPGGIDTVSNFGPDDFIAFTGGLSYWDDTILGDMKSKGSIIDAAQYVMGNFDGWALGFIYNGESYVVIDGALGNNQFNPATDSIVNLTGTNLSSLTSQNFIG